MASATEKDPSTSSWYVGDAFYESLVAAFAGWDRDERALRDPARRDAVRAFLEREARLLDQGRFEAWLALFTPECAYWVPGTPDRGDPRREITVAFHDRRQLEDRVYRLGTGYAWSQTPASRTVRSISNVEPFATDNAGIVMARSNFHIAELLDGDLRHWAGWAGHRLATTGGGFSILAKQINLIDCDRPLRNPSIVF